MNVMRRKFLLLLAPLFVTASSLNGQTLHAINFANTIDRNIGKSCEVDYNRFNNEVAEIATYIDYNVEFYTYAGEDCSRENLLNTIKNMRCSSNDIIIFYYSGHGVRNPKDESPFPQMCLKYGAYDEAKFVAVHTVVEMLEKKNAHLTLVLTDCCNSESEMVSSKSLLASAKGISKYEESYAVNYRKLFLEQSGTIVATSSMIGQTSGCNVLVGGFFSYVFYENLHLAGIGKKKASWESIFSNIKSDLVGKQEPYYTLPGQSVGNSVSTNANNVTHVISTDGQVGEALKPLMNHNLSSDYRLSIASDLLRTKFAAKAKVVTMGRNGTTVVDVEDAKQYLDRIALSTFIREVIVLKVSRDSSGKINSMTVREIRNK